MREPSLLRYYVGLILAESAVIIVLAIWLWRVRDELDHKPPKRKDPPWMKRGRK